MTTKAKVKDLGKARVKAKKQVTIPDAVMEALRLKEGGEIRFRTSGKSVYIESVKTITVPVDEAYAFTPTWQASIRRAMAEIEAGEVYTVKPDEVLSLARKLRKEGKI